MLDAYTFYAGLRLRWYALASGRLLLRHWQWFLVAGLIVPGIPIAGILGLPSSLLVEAVSSRGSLLWTLAAVIAVQALAVLWAAPQRRAVLGGEFASFASSLPISNTVQRCTDLTILWAADLLPAVPLGVAVVEELLEPHGHGTYRAVALCILGGTALVAQMATLERRAGALAGVAGADFLLASGLTSSPGAMAWLFAALALIVVAVAALLPSQRRRLAGSSLGLISSRTSAGAWSGSSWIWPWMRIQFKALAAHPVVSTTRLVLAVSVAIATISLVGAFQFDARSLPTIVVAMAMTGLLVSGFYRLLRDVHVPMQAFLATLPLSLHYWALRDILFVVTLGAVPGAILLVWLAVGGHVLLPALVGLAVAYPALLALLRLPLVWGAKLSAFVGVLIAAGWAGAAIAVVGR